MSKVPEILSTKNIINSESLEIKTNFKSETVPKTSNKIIDFCDVKNGIHKGHKQFEEVT